MMLARKQWLVFCYALLLVGAAVLPFAQRGCLGLVVNESVSSSGTVLGFPRHYVALGALLLCAGFVPVCHALQEYVRKLFRFFLEARVETCFMDKRAELDVAMHEDPACNDIYTRVSENRWRLQNFLDRHLFIVQDIAEVGIAAVVLLGIDWRISLLVLLGTVPELAVGIVYGRDVWGMYGSNAEVRRRYHDALGRFNRLPDLVELKLYGLQTYFRNFAIQLLESFQAEESKADRKKLFMQVGAVVVSYATLGFAVFWFFGRVARGEIPIGTFVFVMGIIEQFSRSSAGMFRNLGRQFEDNIFVADFFSWLERRPKIVEPAEPKRSKRAGPPEIVFENVSFSYPGAEKPVFRDMSFTINPGERIALVGKNGVGKTTFVKLLCRFYDPTAGRILVDGVDLREMSIEGWHDRLGVLFQQYAHYYTQAGEAIRLGRVAGPHGDHGIERAATRAGAHEVIEAWEKKYETQLGKQFVGGKELSIGQWQKLAMARAFYRNAQVLVLDEPTSSIDAEAEYQIFKDLESSVNRQSMIMISHRFGTVRNVDTIYVVEDGGILEAGNHTTLMAREGRYSQLFLRQAERYR